MYKKVTIPNKQPTNNPSKDKKIVKEIGES